MQKIEIYLETDPCNPSSCGRKYGYVLATMHKGELVTREGFGAMVGTYHQAILRSLSEALNRVRASCEITVFSRNAHVMAHLQKIGEMEAAGFKDAKQNDIRNAEFWKDVSRLVKRHTVTTKYGQHEYTSWLLEEMRKR